MSEYELSDFEWQAIQIVLPRLPRGQERLDDRRILNGILWVLRTGAPWRAMPPIYGSHFTCYNRYVRWRKAGVFDRIVAAIEKAYAGNVEMIDAASVNHHPHATNSKRSTRVLVWAAPNSS